MMLHASDFFEQPMELRRLFASLINAEDSFPYQPSIEQTMTEDRLQAISKRSPLKSFFIFMILFCQPRP